MRRIETKTIKELIREALEEMDLEQKLAEREVVRSWEDLVGKQVARATRSIYIRDGKLYVALRSSVIRNELIYLRNELKEELNRRAGKELIHEIVLR
ncbi:MAG: DUF721 domain-containing protein [Bacteroidales bacterium]|nr:DUF721 domain-containing protein [Bacteroidales bacterium]